MCLSFLLTNHRQQSYEIQCVLIQLQQIYLFSYVKLNLPRKCQIQE